MLLLKGSYSSTQSFYAGPERKRRDGKAAFVHPECISVSALVWIRLTDPLTLQSSHGISDLDCFQIKLNQTMCTRSVASAFKL